MTSDTRASATSSRPSGPAPARAIVAPLHTEAQVARLAPILRRLARGRGLPVRLVGIDRAAAQGAAPGEALTALQADLAAAGVEVIQETRTVHNLQGGLRELVAGNDTEAVVLATPDQGARSSLRDALRVGDLVLDLPRDLIVVAGPPLPVGAHRVLVADLEDEPSALLLAVATVVAGQDGHVSQLVVEPASPGQEVLRAAVQRAEGRSPEAGPQWRVIGRESSSRIAGLLQMADPDSFDVLLLDAPRDTLLHRLGLGSAAERVVARSAIPVVFTKQAPTTPTRLTRRVLRPVSRLIPPLDEEGKVEVYRSVRRGSRPSADFFLMMALASIIAAFGLLLDSAAVVIGGMLVAPLMLPITGLGLGIVHGEPRLLAHAAGSVLRGAVLAAGCGVVIAALAPGSELTNQVLQRGDPSLLDLGVAIAAGLAGAYALGRANFSAALPGVAIAAALVPPLAALGIGLALEEWRTARGAALLFLANAVAIAAASGLVFLAFGFRPEPGRAMRLQIFGRGATALLVLTVGVAVPLGILTADSVRSSNLRSNVEEAMDAALAARSGWELAGLEVTEEQGTVSVRANINSPVLLTGADVRELENEISASIGKRVEMALRVTQVVDLRAAETEEVGEGP